MNKLDMISIIAEEIDKLDILEHSSQSSRLTESMIGVVTTGNYKPADLQKALDKAKIKGYSMNRLTQTMTALKVDKKYFQAAQKVIKDSGLAVAMAKESVTEASRKKVFKAAKKGSYPVTLVAIDNGKVVHQELARTPEIVPAAFNVLQTIIKKKHPNAKIRVEDNTGKLLFVEGKSAPDGYHYMPDGKLMKDEDHVKEGKLNEAEKYITNKFKVGDTIKLIKFNWKVTKVNFKPGKSYSDSFTFVDGKQVSIKAPPTNKNAIGYKLEDGNDTAFYYCYKAGSGKTIMKLAVKGFNESVTEAKQFGVKDIMKAAKNKGDWGDLADQLYMKGGNMVHIDSWYYGEDKAMKQLVDSWKKGGSNYDYWNKEHGVDFKIVDTFSEVKALGRHKKLTSDGIVGVVLKVIPGKLNEVKFKSQSDVDKAKKITFPNGKFFTRDSGGKWITKGKSLKSDDKTMAQFVDYAKNMKNIVPVFEGSLNLKEAKIKKGDVIKMDDGEYGVVNKVSGKVAYIKLDSSPGSFHPIEADRITYKGKHKGKDLYSEAINEAMDMNDPILIAVRARKQMLDKAKAAPKVKKISMKQYYKLMDKEIDLINQMKDATKEFEQLNSDMLQDAGQKGDSWSDKDANKWGKGLDKLQTKVEKLADKKNKVKADIMNYRVS